jgi:FPC/CPF motif-containing protein YcgG
MNEPGMQSLVDHDTLEARVESGDLPEWAQAHFDSFTDGLTGERNETPFPCFFGTEAVRNRELLFTCVPSMSDRDVLARLGETLLEYLEVFEDHADRASLVAFFRPPERRLPEADYHDTLWHILQFLHVHDPEPWPEAIPTDPDDPKWEFSFGGDPMFPTCRAPFYDTYKSRYCPIGLEITFQPRRLFENMNVTADTEQGEHARDVIQNRLEGYDGVCPHADLGDWGTEGDREWRQYLFREDETQAPEECPMTVTREHPRSEFLIGQTDTMAAD